MGAAPGCMLFDLDGTLIDTAPDMAGALFDVCDAHGQARPDPSLARATVSNGGMALLRLAFGNDLGTERGSQLLAEFLTTYENRIARESRLFHGMEDVLALLESKNMPWGVITNKPEHLSRLLLEALQLENRSACLIGGDTFPVKKPDPLPLLKAADLCAIPAQRCWYVGDNVRDIEAGNAAGMISVAADWGYIVPGDSSANWRAHLRVSQPDQLTDLINSPVQ